MDKYKQKSLEDALDHAEHTKRKQHKSAIELELVAIAEAYQEVGECFGAALRASEKHTLWQDPSRDELLDYWRAHRRFIIGDDRV